jgi:predicted dehydrogenase
MKPIGLAFWGLHHQHPRWYWPLFQNLPQFRPLCLFDNDRDFARGEAEFFQLDLAPDPAALLARSDVEAVMIFLPHREMPAAVAQAIAAGKHVLVEKPMGATLADVERVCSAAAGAGGLKITTGYCWRFDPMARRIKEWIEAGLLGRITHFEGRMTAGGPWRYLRDHAPWMLEAGQGGGPLWNLGVHWIDLFHWWTGDAAAAVQATCRSYGGEPARTIEDSADVILEYASGAVALLDISYTAPRSFPQARDLFVSVRGTLGSVLWYPSWGGDDNEVLFASDHESLAATAVQQIKMPTAKIPGYCGQMGLDYLADWADAIRRDRPVSIPVTDGLQAAAVADAALRSAQGGGRITL